MITLPIGMGDFEREISVELEGREGTLRIVREIGREYGEKKNETDSFMYTLLLDSVGLCAYGDCVQLRPKTLVRIAPGAKYSLEPSGDEQPLKMREGLLPVNPIKSVTFLPPMMESPTKKEFLEVKLFRPDSRMRDWYCGYYNEGAELGITPIEIAHGYVGNDYLGDPSKNTPHYHRKILEGWIPLYGSIDAIISPVADADVAKNYFSPVPVGREKLSDLVNNPPISVNVNISPRYIIATVPGEAHILKTLKDSAIWETLTFKYPGLSEDESKRDKVEYRL